MEKKSYKIPFEMSDDEIELRDRLIDELKHRTGAAVVNIAAYTVEQHIEPFTSNPTQVHLECRVNNQVSHIVLSKDEVHMMRGGRALYYGFREITNRMLDMLIKAGTQSLY